MLEDQNNQSIAQRNPNALGNAWFVSDIIIVENSDEEIQKLGQINTANQVVVDQRYDVPPSIEYDSTATIQLTNYKANHLTYISSASIKQFAVFSEIYYDKGWNAYIDGELVPHIRANYLVEGIAYTIGSA